jgi:threonine/homoserine/homoserine lactone efflux protein
MNTGLYIAFVVAAALLIVSPGPTVMLITSVSLRRGVRAGLIAVAGSTLAAALQLAVVVAGLASVVSVAGHGFEWIRWLGVGYLVYLGLTGGTVR